MKTAIVVAVFGIVAGIFWLGYVHFRYAEQKAEATQEASKMMELRTRLAPELENFYKNNGAYPQSLRDLPLDNFHWGAEGAEPKDLGSFSYVSDGQTFRMRWEGRGGFVVCLAGSKGVSDYSEDGAASKIRN